MWCGAAALSPVYMGPVQDWVQRGFALQRDLMEPVRCGSTYPSAEVCILLKHVSKLSGLNFEIVAVTRPCITFFLFR